MGELEALKAVAALGLLPHHVQDTVHQLCTLCVVTLGPVVTRTRLTEDKVVRPEDGSIGPGPDTVHGAGLQIDEDGTGHKLSASGQPLPTGLALGGEPLSLVVVHIDPLHLQLGGAGIGTVGVDAMLIADNLPEFGTDLVATLSGLQMHNFPHGCNVCLLWSAGGALVRLEAVVPGLSTALRGRHWSAGEVELISPRHMALRGASREKSALERLEEELGRGCGELSGGNQPSVGVAMTHRRRQS